MNMDAFSLSNLHDIVDPPTIALWPPAPGLVLLGMLILLWAAVALVLWWRHWQRNAYRREALADMTAIAARIRSPQTRAVGLQQLSVLLKRVALAAHPRADVASLTGDEWDTFLDQHIGENLFRKGPGQVLAAAMNDPDPGDGLTSADYDRLIQAVRRWINGHRTAADWMSPAEAGA